MRVNRVYDRLTLQGEGPYSGARCTFVRLYGCNLHCRWCDSAETWDIKGRNGIAYPAPTNHMRMSPSEIAAEVALLDVDLVVVTGGEPLLQREELGELARLLRLNGAEVHIETNGTLSPGHELASQVEHFVVSPKLPSADPGEGAINHAVLRGYVRMGWRRASFKVVVTTPGEVAAVRQLYDSLGVHRRARWVMPEGTNARTVAKHLAGLAEQALDAGLSVSGRQHVMLWGDERGR